MNRWQTYAQLVRLPNLPSALADICMGALAAHTARNALREAQRQAQQLPLDQLPPEPFAWLSFGLLLLASACLYWGGMVWNDYFDREQDYRERPERPIPSGRVSLREAYWLGVGLLAA